MAPLFQQPFMSGGFPSMNRAVASAWDFEDNFSTDKGWVDNSQNISFNAANDNIDWDISSADSAIVKDLQDADALNGVNASDTAWVLRYTHTINNYTASSASSDALAVGLANTNQTVTTGATDGVGNEMGVGTFDTQWRVQAVDNGTWVRGSPEHTFTITPSVGTDYIEIIRASATVETVQHFSDTGYSSSLEASGNITIDSTNNTHRYIKIVSDSQAAGNTADGVIDDIFFANGVTVAP